MVLLEPLDKLGQLVSQEDLVVQVLREQQDPQEIPVTMDSQDLRAQLVYREPLAETVYLETLERLVPLEHLASPDLLEPQDL